jgi:hypothetical protein
MIAEGIDVRVTLGLSAKVIESADRSASDAVTVARRRHAEPDLCTQGAQIAEYLRVGQGHYGRFKHRSGA